MRRIVPITSVREVSEGIFALAMKCQEISDGAEPGQFLNILLREGNSPLLRRPFSISWVENGTIEIIFNVIGQGTRIMAHKRAGEELDLIGPLGQPFRIDETFDTALLVGGGLGVAPLPFHTKALSSQGKSIVTYLGARSASHIYAERLLNVEVATDDGSRGFHGTVVDLLRDQVPGRKLGRAKIFGCGPTPMLKALAAFALQADIPCELSLEGDMACGIGICQGCPVELSQGDRKYALVCTDGPSFNAKDIVLG